MNKNKNLENEKPNNEQNIQEKEKPESKEPSQVEKTWWKKSPQAWLVILIPFLIFGLNKGCEHIKVSQETNIKEIDALNGDKVLLQTLKSDLEQNLDRVNNTQNICNNYPKESYRNIPNKPLIVNYSPKAFQTIETIKLSQIIGDLQGNLSDLQNTIDAHNRLIQTSFGSTITQQNVKSYVSGIGKRCENLQNSLKTVINQIETEIDNVDKQLDKFN